MRRERSSEPKMSIYGTPYKTPRKKDPKSPAERRREENSLVIRNIYTGGGNDIA